MKTMTSNMDTTTMDTTRTMKKGFNLGLAAFAAASIMLCSYEAWAGATQARNPPECDKNSEDCGCDNGEEVTPACIKVNLALGGTTPWTRSMSCALKIFADSDSPNVFSQDSLYAVLGGYTFKRLGTKNLSDGVTPAEVVLAHPQGEPVHFVFKDGESMARPDPGVHIKMDERLQMVDAEGWATTHDPVYYDLYVGDGSRRRFLATDMTGALGSLVSITDARGVTVTPADMGVDIIYDANGARQFLTPSRLADVIPLPGFKGFEVKVYALQTVPQKNAATGLYVPPQATPVKHLQVRPENGWRRAIVTLKSGDNDPRRYVFDYALGDWSMTRSSGVEERKEREVADGRAAYIKNETIAADGTLLSRKVKNYSYESWGFAMTNRVEGFDGVTNVTEWTYYTSGNGKGQVKTEKRQSGLLIQYAYDNVDRIISETRSGPDMMTETTTYDYTPVDASDPVLPVDTRPRTVVRKLNNIECARTYYVYSPFTNIVERVGTQGAAYGSTNALRTVTAFYPVIVNDLRSGFVQSIRHEDGKLDVYDYALTSNLWVETVTHLHEQSPSPISGKTTRDITLTNARCEISETRTEAYIDGIWYPISRVRMTYNAEGKRTSLQNLAGQVTTTAWDCCHKVSEVQPDGSTTTWDYDDEGRITATSRLIPLDMTNVTWVTTCYSYDALGRQTATWTTNTTAHIGIPATTTSYDALGRVTSRSVPGRGTSLTSYSSSGLIVTNTAPNGALTITRRNADGDTISVTGDGVTPEFYSRGILADGTRWTKTVQGETADSPRYTKSYENLLGETIRNERSGFRGAVLATVSAYDAYGRLVSTAADGEPAVEYAYDSLGERIATTLMVGIPRVEGEPRSDALATVGIPRAEGESRSDALAGVRGVPSAPQGGEWRRSESTSTFALIGSDVWLVQTNITSCSDATIAPLVQSSSRQLTGLTLQNPARTRTTDIRGNATEDWVEFTDGFMVAKRRVPEATNVIRSCSRYGIELETVSLSAVTNKAVFDSLGRTVARIDGRGNATRTAYDAFGRQSAIIDPIGARTTYAYGQFGDLIAITNALGNATVYEYDLRGRKTYEGGATYPVRYAYDIFGNKVLMTTYRNENGLAGDTTTWLYDEASGLVTQKLYADGHGPCYTYSGDGRLTTRTWARGVETFYSYDSWGNLASTTYSDDTPSISLAYDAMGRQIQATDAAGTTTFTYDAFGANITETVVGVAGTNIIERFADAFGRDAGYALNGVRQSTLTYDPTTGRFVTMLIAGSEKPFAWNYLAGSDLKQSLAYPNGLTASWTYSSRNELLEVDNAFPTGSVSKFTYTYDAAGRRIACDKSGSAFATPDTYAYLYNARSELTNATSAVDADYRYCYRFDDIGNRETSSERGTNAVYAANQLNQYEEVDDFVPAYDDDGNQTLIKTATGIWQVAYNGENRPIRWVNDGTVITMSYDRMGRRVTKNDQRFVYNDYLQIAGSAGNAYVWDPTEPVATRPLVWKHGDETRFYTHDGNKNVSEVVSANGEVAAHYECAPFGAVIRESGALVAGSLFRFSSEYADDTLGLVYYNYRHYEPLMGRWLSRDPADEDGGIDVYCFQGIVSQSDWLGLVTLEPTVSITTRKCPEAIKSQCKTEIEAMIRKLKGYLSVRPSDRARFSHIHRMIKKMRPQGAKAVSEEGNFKDLVKQIVKDLEDSTTQIRCCPPLDSGICSNESTVSVYVTQVPQAYMDWVGSIVFCSNDVKDLDRSGGCACLVLHELMHKRGMGNLKVNANNKAAYESAKKANRPNENYMIYMAQALLGRLCKGYDVNDWHASTKPAGEK